MTTIAIPADSSTLILNGFAITDFMEGDTIDLTPLNPVTEHTNGSGGSVSINARSDGGVHDLVARVLKYSPSDVFLNNAINQVAPVVMNGSLKENYVKDGVDAIGSWLLESGSITTRPTDVKNSQEGNNLMEYTIKFRNASRSI